MLFCFLIIKPFLDPVFYLHHTQVDRLWWIWQQQDPAVRLYAYEGPGENVRIHGHKTENVPRTNASLEDVLSLGTLAKDLLVKDVMSTNSDLLCYGY